ncbi:MAG: type II toxin-antitoxin system VapC family toxin [Candidatus Aenigmarchaeota archaeon]|nr:type II toxin-antitoxin system VapC family toxin [Candidatus Aenigmarchaeota archaeon]
MDKFVFDTTWIVKGLVKPRRRKDDEELQHQLRLHNKAKEYLQKVEENEIRMIIPSLALIETASVVSRLTNDSSLSRDAVSFLWENAEKIFFDFETLDTSIEMGIKTKSSGFDTLYLALLKLTGAALLTDDSKLHDLAKSNGYESKLLREML